METKPPGQKNSTWLFDNELECKIDKWITLIE